MINRNDIARAMTALSHPRRVAIFEALETAGPAGLGFEALLERTRLQPSTLRHHLRPMMSARLVTSSRRGLNVFYSLHGAEVLGVTAGVNARLSAVITPSIAAE